MIIQAAKEADLESILLIYNQGIEDRVATLEQELKTQTYMNDWFHRRLERHPILVAIIENLIVGWASLNPYSARSAYDGVGEISVYIHREFRGRGVGQKLLQNLETVAKENNFYKMVLFTFPFNVLGQGLYRKAGYREVGTFMNQGLLDGKFVDVMIMEKLI